MAETDSGSSLRVGAAITQIKVITMAETVQKGVLKTWKDDRGFGFIQPDDGGKDIFVHISALKGMARRPVRGDILHYQVSRDGGDKFRAINASIEGVEFVQPANKSKHRWLWLLAVILGLISAAVAGYSYFAA
jgi:CspA family cold shock protein